MNIQADDFTLFDLPQRFSLDRAVLDERWRLLQAQVHPDRFAAQGASAQRVAMQWAVRVNEAHRRLKSPLDRAAYLCEMRGTPIDAERNTVMPPAFLMQQMVWREALAEATQATELESLDDAVVGFELKLSAEVARLLDEAGDPQAAAQEVRAWMFVRRFRADLMRRLNALQP